MLPLNAAGQLRLFNLEDFSGSSCVMKARSSSHLPRRALSKRLERAQQRVYTRGPHEPARMVSRGFGIPFRQCHYDKVKAAFVRRELLA